MVGLPKMANLMRDDIIQNIVRRQDQPSVEGKIAFG